MAMDWLEKFEKSRLQQKKDFFMEVIPSTYSTLDKELGCWGIPRGKVIEISGGAGIGKTALLLDIVASAQSKDLNVVYLDLDRKFDRTFAENRGIKIDNLLIYRPEPSQPENLIIALRSFIQQNLVDVIVFDTISAYGDGMINIFQELVKDIAGTKITVLLASQIRENFEDPRDYNTPYMKILNQYCNIRLFMKKIESLKHCGIFIGKKVAIDIYKNTLYHPSSTEIEIYV